jgi:hypothetical protein
MPRKRVKPEKDELKEVRQEMEEEGLVELEDELEPEELESFEEEFSEGETLDDLDEEALEEMSIARTRGGGKEASPEPAREADGRRRTPAKGSMAVEDDEMEAFEEFEEEEEVPETPMRRETRQEMLGRLMVQLLGDREQVHMALERVRDLNTELRDAGPRPSERLREAYHKAISDLSKARREENFARAELMQVLSWRG